VRCADESPERKWSKICFAGLRIVFLLAADHHLRLDDSYKRVDNTWSEGLRLHVCHKGWSTAMNFNCAAFQFISLP
jgi:hypothetical protein